MQGYLRSDGRKGIRNYLVVAYLVECAHHVAREIMLPNREHGVQLIGFSGCYPNAYASDMIAAFARTPMWEACSCCLWDARAWIAAVLPTPFAPAGGPFTRW